MKRGCRSWKLQRQSLLAIATALALSLFTPAQAQWNGTNVLPAYTGFIRVQDGRFVDADCNEFPVTGMNTWELMETAAGVATQPYELPGVDPVHFTFGEASSSGFTVVRSFAQGVNASLQLQTSPGVYNETAFRALDYILDVASQYGVRVLWTLGDNWQSADSKINYLQWANMTDNEDAFWTDPLIMGWYQDHMRVMANRVNTINGIMYKDDPTIFAWDLINEPRCNCFATWLPTPDLYYTLQGGCNPDCANAVTAWVGNMSAAMKAVDPNHLVTVGEEGFWAAYDADSVYNPGNGWASLTGDNFTAQHAFEDIDFCGVHYWPDLWEPGTYDEPFFAAWMASHQSACAALGKPLILEEFGKNSTVDEGLPVLEASIEGIRAPVMSMVYDMFNASFSTGGNWRGVLFWQWELGPYNSDDNDLEVAARDSDFTGIIVPAARTALAQAVAASPLQNCVLVEYNGTAPANSSTTDVGYQSAVAAAGTLSTQSIGLSG